MGGIFLTLCTPNTLQLLLLLAASKLREAILAQLATWRCYRKVAVLVYLDATLRHHSLLTSLLLQLLSCIHNSTSAISGSATGQ